MVGVLETPVTEQIFGRAQRGQDRRIFHFHNSHTKRIDEGPLLLVSEPEAEGNEVEAR